MTISTDSTTGADEAGVMMFQKSYKPFLTVFMRNVDCFYIEIWCELCSGFIGFELGKVYYCKITDFSVIYTEDTKISARELQWVLLEEQKHIFGAVVESTAKNVQGECPHVLSGTDNIN